MTSQVKSEKGAAMTDVLGDLDPDDPRTPSQQIANALRAAILMGRFEPGEKLPSQHALVARYGVARETVKSALRILDREQLIVSRQGSGVFVRARQGNQLDLQGLLRKAFDREHVTIDYAGYQGETLANTLLPSLKEIGAGTLRARSLRLRMLLLDPAAFSDFPRRVDGRRTDAALRRTLARVTEDAVGRLTEAVRELTDAGVLRSGTVEVRLHGLGPMMKVYLLNNEQVLLGFYPVTEYSVNVKGESVPLHHPSGWDAALFTGNDAGVEISGPPFAEQARAWFESVWSTIARPYQP